MSENNNLNPEELVEDVEYEVDDAEGIPFPIDPTLTIEGEAADAKATGDAIRGIASAVKVNNQTADNTGNITVLATQIAMDDSQGAQTVAQAIQAAQEMSAEDILFDPDEQATISEVVTEATDAITNGVTDEEIDAIFDGWEEDE